MNSNTELSQTNSDVGAFIASRHEHFLPFVSSTLGNEYIVTPFDDVINTALDKTITGEIKRLVINIPPRMGKTLRAVIAYVSRGFAINPASNFIHSSYSDKLVQANSAQIRKVLSDPDYQRMYPYVKLQGDTNAKGLWKTTIGGGFLASPFGGTITGFGAGIIGCEHEFSGALIIDDPMNH